MKKHVVHILLVTTALAMGLAYRYQHQHVGEETTPLQAPVVAEPKRDVRAAIPPRPKPVVKKTEPKALPKIVAPQVKALPKPAKVNHRQASKYRRNAARRFDQQGEMLDQENDPAKRMSLIRTMGRNVRVDTLRTLDWAMKLEDPAEQRAALDAINQNALVGIGARLHVDETGLPKIMNTTVLSAIASTGIAEHGDYISGMVNANGSTISFKNRPIREIVNLLHGQPGTEVRLLMERAPSEGQTEPTSYEVPVIRSIIVMPPAE